MFVAPTFVDLFVCLWILLDAALTAREALTARLGGFAAMALENTLWR